MVIAQFLAAPVQAQVYKCVDAKGVTQYADKPCPGGREVDIRAQPPISGKLNTHGTDLGTAESDFQKRQQDRRRADEKEAAIAAERKKRCAAAQAEHKRWIEVGRVRVADAKGERRYMDDEERAAKIAQLAAEVARYCN